MQARTGFSCEVLTVAQLKLEWLLICGIELVYTDALTNAHLNTCTVSALLLPVSLTTTLTALPMHKCNYRRTNAQTPASTGVLAGLTGAAACFKLADST